MLTVKYWQDRLYPTPESRDPGRLLVAAVNRLVGPQSRVLDLGAGAGLNNSYDFRGRVAHMAGVDLDPRVTGNPLLDEGVVADISATPFPDASFDVVFSIYVLEHLTAPDAFAREVARLLKPGGLFLALTPNKRHYVPLLASLTPDAFHRWYNAKRGRQESDTFPTRYLLNTLTDQRQIFTKAGLETVSLDTVEVQPNYLLFSLPSFLLGALYERIVNSAPAFKELRVNILSVFRKSSEARP